MTVLPHRGTPPTVAAAAPSAPLVPLVLAGLALALVLGVGLAWPLALWQQPTIIRTDRPLATVFGPDLGGALRFAVPAVAAVAVYGVAIRLAGPIAGRRARRLVVAVTALLALTLLPLNPVGAHDVYHNVADARTLWRYGDNPLSVPPRAYPDDPMYRQVPAWQSTPSVYGPLWYLLGGLPLALAGDDLWANVLGQKLLTVAFLLGTTVLAMRVAERIRPGSGVAAGVLVGWNPLLQFETAGNAHNDVVMAGLTLAALAALVYGRWRATFPLLSLGVAAKYVVVLLGPLLLVWLWRRPDVPRREIVRSLAGGLLVGGSLFLPFLRDGAVLTALTREAGFAAASPTAVLHTLLLRVLPLDGLQALTLLKLLLVPPLAVAYLRMLWRLPGEASLAAVVERAVPCLLWCFVGAVAWFGPWYATLLAVLGALLVGERPAHVAALFSATALLLYLPLAWLPRAEPLVFHALTAGLAFGPALVVQFWPRRWAPA